MTESEAALVASGDRAIMRAQIAALFTHDDRERMLRVNEPNGSPAPRFFLGRTSQGSELRVRYDVDDVTRQALEALRAREPMGAELIHEPYGARPYAEVLARVARVEHIEAGPAYRFPPSVPDAPAVVPITHETAPLLRPHLVAWSADVGQTPLIMAVIVDGSAVSVCASVRVTAIVHEAGVDTAAAFRGHGYALQAVAAWARAVRRMGAMPLYSTSWENAASQAVARKLGLIRYGTDLHIR